eukprot:366463-Chlamydomonas_euryale.AAC.2
MRSWTQTASCGGSGSTTPLACPQEEPMPPPPPVPTANPCLTMEGLSDPKMIARVMAICVGQGQSTDGEVGGGSVVCVFAWGCSGLEQWTDGKASGTSRHWGTEMSVRWVAVQEWGEAGLTEATWRSWFESWCQGPLIECPPGDSVCASSGACASRDCYKNFKCDGAALQAWSGVQRLMPTLASFPHPLPSGGEAGFDYPGLYLPALACVGLVNP